jgi:hypothetical protein
MQVPEDAGQKIFRAGAGVVDWLHSQGVVDLFPVDLAQQFLDTVFRAEDPDFYVLNERRIRLMNKEIPINVIDLFPAAIFGAAEK